MMLCSNCFHYFTFKNVHLVLQNTESFLQTGELTDIFTSEKPGCLFISNHVTNL